jgi:hypothetical protein
MAVRKFLAVCPNIDLKRLFANTGFPIRGIDTEPPLWEKTNFMENRKYADHESLRVLAESERKLGETEEGQKHIRLAQTNWSGNVEKLPLSLL